MKRNRAEYSLVAQNDLEEILLYIREDSIAAADKLQDKIEESIERLKNFPNLGRLIQDKCISDTDIRMLPIGNYLLFYQVYPDEIYIKRILHGARDYRTFFTNEPKGGE